MENKIDGISDDFLNAALLLRMIRNDGARHPGLMKAEKILICLKAGQPLSEKALSEQSGIAPARLKRWLKLLEYEDLVNLEDKNEDGRVITLTERGSRKAEKIQKNHARAEGIFESLSEEDRQKLSAILEQLLPLLMKEADCDEDDLDPLQSFHGFDGFPMRRHHPGAGFMRNCRRFGFGGLFD